MKVQKNERRRGTLKFNLKMYERVTGERLIFGTHV